MAPRTRRGFVACCLVGASLLTGCASTQPMANDDIGHVYNTAHPWHSYPAYAATGALALPWGIVLLPVWAVAPGESNSHGGSLTRIWLLPPYAFGTVVGGAFYVVGYPLEFVFPADETQEAPKAPPPELPRPRVKPAPGDAS